MASAEERSTPSLGALLRVATPAGPVSKRMRCSGVSRKREKPCSPHNPSTLPGTVFSVITVSLVMAASSPDSSRILREESGLNEQLIFAPPAQKLDLSVIAAGAGCGGLAP